MRKRTPTHALLRLPTSFVPRPFDLKLELWRTAHAGVASPPSTPRPLLGSLYRKHASEIGAGRAGSVLAFGFSTAAPAPCSSLPLLLSHTHTPHPTSTTNQSQNPTTQLYRCGPVPYLDTAPVPPPHPRTSTPHPVGDGPTSALGCTRTTDDYGGALGARLHAHLRWLGRSLAREAAHPRRWATT